MASFVSSRKEQSTPKFSARRVGSFVFRIREFIANLKSGYKIPSPKCKLFKILPTLWRLVTGKKIGPGSWFPGTPVGSQSHQCVTCSCSEYTLSEGDRSGHLQSSWGNTVSDQGRRWPKVERDSCLPTFLTCMDSFSLKVPTSQVMLSSFQRHSVSHLAITTLLRAIIIATRPSVESTQVRGGPP